MTNYSLRARMMILILAPTVLIGLLLSIFFVAHRYNDLQRQLEGTENRINTERNRFNEVVQPYNTKVRSFPTNIFAGMFGFRPRPPFEADPGARNAPRVDFGTGNQPSVNFDTSKNKR